MLPTHPAWIEKKDTTNRLTLLSPDSQPKPTASAKFAGGSQLWDKSMFASTASSTFASGYDNNAQLQDGKGYKTASNLHTD